MSTIVAKFSKLVGALVRRQVQGQVAGMPYGIVQAVPLTKSRTDRHVRVFWSSGGFGWISLGDLKVIVP